MLNGAVGENSLTPVKRVSGMSAHTQLGDAKCKRSRLARNGSTPTLMDRPPSRSCRSVRTQENHEARIPIPSMPRGRRPAHTVPRVATLPRTKIRVRLSGSFEFTHRSSHHEHHEMANPGCCRDPFWLRNHDVRCQSVTSNFPETRTAESIQFLNTADLAGFRHRAL